MRTHFRDHDACAKLPKLLREAYAGVPLLQFRAGGVRLGEGEAKIMLEVVIDSLLVFGSLAILLAPLTLAIVIAETRPSGTGWTVLTFVCCTVAAWFLFFASSLVIAFVAWLLAWACAMALRMSFNRRRA
jgi:hypothetical protein